MGRDHTSKLRNRKVRTPGKPPLHASRLRSVPPVQPPSPCTVTLPARDTTHHNPQPTPIVVSSSRRCALQPACTLRTPAQAAP